MKKFLFARHLVAGIALVLVSDIPAAASATPTTRNTAQAAEAAAWPEQEVFALDGQADDQFGLHAVMDGDTAMISAPLAPAGTWQGAVYVFDNVDGQWIQTQELTASDAAPSNEFGGYLALVGDTAFIGAPEYPGVGGPNDRVGGVYVFTRAAGTWIQTQKLTIDEGVSLDQFGGTIAFDGTTALIASNDFEDAGQGAVYAFTKANGIWTRTQKITATGDAPPGTFGGALAVAGSSAFVSALDYNPDVAEGWVYVLARDAQGTWNQSAVLTSQNTDDYFGDSLATDGVNTLIGAPGTTIGANVWQGAVYVYTQSTGGAWVETQQLTADDGADDDIFGFVAMHGHRALVGAQHASGGIGAAYAFSEANGVWTQVQKLVPSDGVANDAFAPGQIAISDTYALVGAWAAAPHGNVNQGTAYFYSSDTIFQGGFETSP